jgi:hypothetical protein
MTFVQTGTNWDKSHQRLVQKHGAPHCCLCPSWNDLVNEIFQNSVNSPKEGKRAYKGERATYSLKEYCQLTSYSFRRALAFSTYKVSQTVFFKMNNFGPGAITVELACYFTEGHQKLR